MPSYAMYLVMTRILKNWLTQIKKGYLDLCILSLIQEQEKTYGFELLSQLKSLGIFVKEGTLYPLLSRMTKEGLLCASWETKSTQGHPRKFYALTPLGSQSLEEMKVEYQSMYQIFKKINGEHRGK